VTADSSLLTYAVYLLPLAGLFAWSVWQRASFEATSAQTLREAEAAGLTQPASLHPVVDPLKCIGCASCVHACPEFPAHRVLGIIAGKAGLVSPTDCIGHGACRTACPTGAISLVFGSAERGVDVPAVNPDFSTNVPGVYVAGELGGMGLIRNAIEQGRQSMDAVARFVHAQGPADGDVLDVAIVGAGPAGIAATLGAMKHGLRHVTIEQNALGGTVANFPRAKIVMTAPAELPLVGTVKIGNTTKEALLGFWNDVHRDTGMRVNYGERLDSVAREDAGLLSVATDRNTYRARAVVLAIGRRGTPRRLGVPGEHLAKVTYSLVDAAQYRGLAVLVVGGGDSALEAALALAAEPGTRVTLSYRAAAFTRAKARNRTRLEVLAHAGDILVLLESAVVAIEPDAVALETRDGPRRLANDAVIVCAGGILPDGLLRDIGITVETRYGT
jgi:thioredoxin reductase (NADPH)